MKMLEMRIEQDEMTLEDYEYTMTALKDKISQIESSLKSHVV